LFDYYIIFLFFTLLILSFAIYQWQYFKVFSPTSHKKEMLDDRFEQLVMEMPDGIRLEGVVFTPSSFSSTMLYFTGRSQDSVGMIKRFSVAYPKTRIVTFNHRSFGASEGIINDKNILLDGVEIARIVKKNYGDIYVFGFSLGCSVALEVVNKVEIKAVFLVGAFDTLANLAKAKYNFIPNFLYRYSFNNITKVKNLNLPTYLFASSDDDIVFVENTHNLRDNIKNLVLYKEYKHLTHRELLFYDDVIKTIRSII